MLKRLGDKGPPYGTPHCTLIGYDFPSFVCIDTSFFVRRFITRSRKFNEIPCAFSAIEMWRCPTRSNAFETSRNVITQSSLSRFALRRHAFINFAFMWHPGTPVLSGYWFWFWITVYKSKHLAFIKHLFKDEQSLIKCWKTGRCVKPEFTRRLKKVAHSLEDYSTKFRIYCG